MFRGWALGGSIFRPQATDSRAAPDNCPTKAAGAVSLVSKQCECGKAQPNFGLPDEGKRRWCFKCPTKSQGAVDL